MHIFCLGVYVCVCVCVCEFVSCNGERYEKEGREELSKKEHQFSLSPSCSTSCSRALPLTVPFQCVCIKVCIELCTCMYIKGRGREEQRGKTRRISHYDETEGSLSFSHSSFSLILSFFPFLLLPLISLYSRQRKCGESKRLSGMRLETVGRAKEEA